MHWNGGPGTNNMAEIMALWGGLLAVVNMDLSDLHIYGDFDLIIGVIMGCLHLQIPDLQGWICRIRRIWQRLGSPPIEHIYRDLNTRADGLSKRGLNADYGFIQVLHYRDGVQFWDSTIPMP